MEERFEFVYMQKIEIDPIEEDYYYIRILRDKLTGITYLSTDDGLTPLLSNENGSDAEYNVKLD